MPPKKSSTSLVSSRSRSKSAKRGGSFNKSSNKETLRDSDSQESGVCCAYKDPAIKQNLIQKMGFGSSVDPPCLWEKVKCFFSRCNKTAWYTMLAICHVITFVMGVVFALMGFFVIYNLCSITELARALFGFFKTDPIDYQYAVTKYATVVGYACIIYGTFLVKISMGFFYCWWTSETQGKVHASPCA